MKKSRLIQYISLPLLATMYSCSNDVEKSDIPVIVPSTNEITFSVGSVSDSRATIMDNSNFVADGRTIGIYANKHKGNLSNSAFEANVMNNEELVYSNAIWSYSPMQFWSNSQDTLYSFVAYSPYHVNASIKDNNVVIPYDCAVKNNEQVDLLWGVTKDIYTPNNPVSLNFKHALSKVVFNVDGFVNGSDISNVKINNVIITGLSNSAEFSVEAYSNKSFWGAYSNVANILVSNESLILTNSKSQIGEPLLLIPQELTNAKLIVEYDIYSESVGDYDSKRVEFALSTAVTAAWSANKTYTYNLHLDLNAIEFSLSVHISDFETETEVDVELPNDGKAYTLMYYKSTDGQIVEPYNLDAFDAKLISNTYEDGQGTMMFEGVLTEIGYNAFSVSSLEEIKLPETVKFIGNDAFAQCHYLKRINLSDNLESIQSGAFWDTSIDSIYIPKNVIDIESATFANCNSLVSIHVDINNLIYDSRDNCNAIIDTDVDKLIVGCNRTIIPNSVISIGSYAFYFCDQLYNIVIPQNVIEIDEDAFRVCSNIETIDVDINNAIYDSRDNCNAIVETITNRLIKGCKNTKIPNSITSIGACAFESCNDLDSLILPSGVKNIENGAFYGCSDLEYIYISNSVESVEVDAFSSCENLEVVRIDSRDPYVWQHRNSVFENCPSLTIIQVPIEAVENYKNAEGWREYADLIVGVE